MQHQSFDDLTRALASGTSRRAAIKVVTGTLAGGILSVFRPAGLGAQVYHDAPPSGPTPTECDAGMVPCDESCVAPCPEGQVLNDACTCSCEGTGLPPCGGACCPADHTCQDGRCVDPNPPAGQCPERSVCGGRHYCNDEQTCICVQTMEGDLRCGQIPSCNATRCQSSADCAGLGEGYFCDVPDSGCCNAQVSLCLAPCDTPACPPERTCGATCCPEGQTCINGACVSPNSCDGSDCFGGRCGSDSDVCLCTSSVEGIGFCMDAFKADCESYAACGSSDECGDGLCLNVAGCCGGRNVCVPASAACPSGVGTVRAWS